VIARQDGPETSVNEPGFRRTVEPPRAPRPATPPITEVAPPPRQPPKSGLRRALPWIVLLVVGFIAARVGVRVWQQRKFQLPVGIAASNGRLEADEIDLSTKFAARVAQLYVNEGDIVLAGQPVARMDTRDLEAQRQTALAQVRQARRAVEEADAAVAQQKSQVALARTQVDRYRELRQKDFVSQEDLDVRQQAYDGAQAALSAAMARRGGAQQALSAAQHVVELYQVNIGDDTLRAPRDGRIEYRIANVGEVLSPGGKVFTMLDAASVYMNIYLPTAEAGRVRVGADARIVLDAYPQDPLPASVSFLASQAQFTPKAVETKSERDKLMFRVKVRILPEVLRGEWMATHTGLPGMAYVRLDSTVAWPGYLQPRQPVATGP